MRYVAISLLCALFVGCAWEAQGDIQQNTSISPTTNFQLDSNSAGQAIGSDSQGHNTPNYKE